MAAWRGATSRASAVSSNASTLGGGGLGASSVPHSSLTRTGALVGTPHYMALEQVDEVAVLGEIPVGAVALRHVQLAYVVLRQPLPKLQLPGLHHRGIIQQVIDQGLRARGRPRGAWAPAAACTSRSGPASPFMAKQDAIELEGTVAEVLPNATFRVETKGGHQVLATLAGNMRRFRIRVLAGDRVTLEVSPYDLTRGRITFRHKN